MKKSNLLYLLILVLVITNGFFIYNHLNKHNKGSHRNPAAFITKKLNFDEDQMVKFDVINKTHEAEIEDLFKNLRGLKNELFTHLGDTLISKEKLVALTNEIGVLEAKRDQKTFIHFNEILKICNASQKEIFKDIITKARKHRKPQN